MRRYVSNGSPGSNRVGSSVSQHSMSTKPAASSRRTVASGVSKWAGPSQPSPIVARTRLTEAMLPAPPHCATSRPPGRQDGGEVREQRVVVGDPVEGRGRQDRVDRPVDRQRAAEVGDDVLDPVAERREPVARGLDHRRRPVERDDATARQALGEQLGHPAAAAAGIEDALVAVERQAVEDDRAPARHRVGDPVVGPGVPVAGHGAVRPWLCGSVDGVLSAVVAVAWAVVGASALAAAGRLGRRRRVRRCGRAARSRSPYHDTAAPIDEQAGTHEHRQVEGLDRGLVRGDDLLRPSRSRPAG